MEHSKEDQKINKAQDPNPRFASEGCSVLLDVNDGDRLVFARLSGGAWVFFFFFQIWFSILYCIWLIGFSLSIFLFFFDSIFKIGNTNYSLKPLIGAPFGSLFQVETGEDGSFLSRILPVKKGFVFLPKFTLFFYLYIIMFSFWCFGYRLIEFDVC